MSKFAGSRIKLEVNCNEALRQHVVNLPGQAAPLTKDGCELPANLTYPVTVNREGSKTSQYQEQAIKPYCPVKERPQIEGKRCALFIPDSIVVAGPDAKGIIACRQMSVRRVPPGGAINP